MNKFDKQVLKPIINRIMSDDINIKLQEQFACIYDDTKEVNEPYVRLPMSDFRSLCRLSGVKDCLTIKKLPHRSSITVYYKENKEGGNKEIDEA